MSSDSTGEIYIITTSNGGSVDAISNITTGTSTTPSPAATSTKTAGTINKAVNNNLPWAISMVCLLAASFVIGLT